MLGTIPHKAPFVYSTIRLKLPGASEYNQSNTIRPVSGITAIKPANVGSFRPICPHRTIITTLTSNLTKNRIN